MRIDELTLATINKRMVLETIRENRSINKAEIARQTELSVPTAMKITDELVERGIVRSCGRLERAGGKRPEMYEFAGDAYYSIGVDIAPTSIKVILMDLAGKVLIKNKCHTVYPQRPDEVVERIAQLVAATINASNINTGLVLGIGVGMPGILDLNEGLVVFSPNFHWENEPLLEPLRKKLMQKTGIDFSLNLENSNRALALGEQFFGSGVGYNYFICINLGYGIGSAVIENGEFYLGSSGTSGELGHITVEKDGPLCTCGNNGCLEAVASGRAIAQQARNLITSGVCTEILQTAGGNLELLEAKHVFEAARHGDLAALDLVRKAGEYIGIGIASYINLLDPEKIVLAGGMSGEEILIEQIERVVNIRRMRFAGRKVKTQVSHLGEFATAVGAASILLKQLLAKGSLPNA